MDQLELMKPNPDNVWDLDLSDEKDVQFAQAVIKHLENIKENKGNPLTTFDECSYEHILILKAMNQDRQPDQPLQYKFGQYKVYNKSADIIPEMHDHAIPTVEEIERKQGVTEITQQCYQESSSQSSLVDESFSEDNEAYQEDYGDDEEDDDISEEEQDDNQDDYSNDDYETQNQNTLRSSMNSSNSDKTNSKIYKQQKENNNQGHSREEQNQGVDERIFDKDLFNQDINENPQVEYQNIELNIQYSKMNDANSPKKEEENEGQQNTNQDNAYNNQQNITISEVTEIEINDEEQTSKEELKRIELCPHEQPDEENINDNNEDSEEKIVISNELLEQINVFDNKEKMKHYINNIFRFLSDFQQYFIATQQQFDVKYKQCQDATEEFEHILNKFISIYKEEKEILSETEDLYRNEKYLPKDIALKKEKIKHFNSFFQLQLQLLNGEISKNFQMNDQQSKRNIDLIFIFANSIHFETGLYFKQLPSYSQKQTIQEQIFDNRIFSVHLLMGETGSGKSTQVPQMLYALNKLYLGSILKNQSIQQAERRNKIICVQPRRIACMTLKNRVQLEMNQFCNVGYYVGNLPHQKQYENAEIIFVTETVFINLLIEFFSLAPNNTRTTNLIAQCSHVIVDEVHERNLKTDIIIGLVHRYLTSTATNSINLRKAYDIQFLLSSATINESSFQNYFFKTGLGTIKIIGRTYPVKVEYLQEVEASQSLKEKLINQIERIIEMKHSEEENNSDLNGHILVFLSDQIEINIMIEECQKLLKEYPRIRHKYEIQQLHGKLNQNDQQRVFEQKEDITKIILATNIAEASITIENVSIVIDSGLEKTMVFDPSRNSNVISIQNISKSQAEQRKGRAGRTRSGICYRLYSEKQHKEYKLDKEPEIVRSNLGYVILKIIETGIRNISEFEFLSRPSSNLIKNSLDTLEDLGAITGNKNSCKLTDIGRCIISTQLEPITARIFIKAASLGVAEEVVKAMAVYSEFNTLFSQKRELMRQIIQDYEKSESQSRNSNHDEEFINQNNSDFIFMWITFDYLRNQNQIFKERGNSTFSLNQKSSMKKINESYNDFNQAMNYLKTFIQRNGKQMEKNTKEIGDIITLNNLKNKKLSKQQIKENIVLSFFTGYSRQLAVYTGIHKFGFLDIQSNIMFYVHPSSSLNATQTNKMINRVYPKNTIIFFSTLEEREVNNFARCSSYLKKEWIKDESLLQKINDKSNFEPFLKLEGEKPMLEYFSKNEFVELTKKLNNYSKENPQFKAKYCVFFQKDIGVVQFYCNEGMQAHMISLNIRGLFERISKEAYQRSLKRELMAVRYKDSFNFAIIKNGLEVKELVLPHQFLQVNILNLPFKSSEQNLHNLLKTIENQKCRDYKEIKIIHNYIEKSSLAEFRFNSTKRAIAFYEALSSKDIAQVTKLVGADPKQQQLQIQPLSECSYYMEQIKNMSKIIVRAQWSICDSLGYGVMYFSNEIDALSTFDQLKKIKLFKVKFDAKDDVVHHDTIHIISIDKLDPYIDEIDLEQYVINNYQGFLSCSIKRQLIDNTSINLLEHNEKQKLKLLLKETLQQQANSKNGNNNANTRGGSNSNEIQISLKINKGICKAELTLDSGVNAQELVDKFDGIEFGCQKLRMQIHNQQKIVMIGAVYKLYFDDIQHYILEASNVVSVKAPKLKEIVFLSKNVYLIVQQKNQNSINIFNKLMFSIKNIIKPEMMYLDCQPEDLEQLIEKNNKVIRSLEIEWNCVLKQSSKHRSELKIWFKKDSSARYIKEAKKKIKNDLSKYFQETFHFLKSSYHFKAVEQYLQKMRQSNKISAFDYDNKRITIKATKNIIMEIKQELNSPKNKYLDSTSLSEEETCEICLDTKKLERLSCNCLFCRQCIYQFFQTQSQDQQNIKPLACPKHMEQPVSLKLISTIFDSQQLQDLIQLRISHSIESIMNPLAQKQKYIRCPSVNCNEFFERIYSQSNDISDKSYPEELTMEENQRDRRSKKSGLKMFNQISPNSYGVAPSKVKCYGCFYEYCLLSSGKALENPDLQIHHSHIQNSCEDYFKDLKAEQENMKGIVLITCPRCQFKATKGEGCNHITCKCGAHFCAKCLEQFDTPKDVYKHLEKVHEGIYN